MDESVHVRAIDFTAVEESEYVVCDSGSGSGEELHFWRLLDCDVEMQKQSAVGNVYEHLRHLYGMRYLSPERYLKKEMACMVDRTQSAIHMVSVADPPRSKSERLVWNFNDWDSDTDEE